MFSGPDLAAAQPNQPNWPGKRMTRSILTSGSTRHKHNESALAPSVDITAACRDFG
jgi:hypothetical protein